jgi:hypothetical protein
LKQKLTKRVGFTIICLSVLLVFSFTINSDNSNNNYQIRILFETYNGFGNNLYIDNLTIGSRFNNDIAVISINNIPKDTSYNTGQNSFIIYPEATIINLGTDAVSSTFTVSMQINNLGYNSIDTIQSIGPGEILKLYFDSLLIYTGIPLQIKVFSSLSGDTNKTNDTLSQKSLFLQGYQRNVVVEEWTSTTSISCSINNPYLDNFIDSNIINITPIKYHVGFPLPGNDSMYLSNITQSEQRKNYYFVNSVPTSIMDGKSFIPPPYYLDSNINRIYLERLNTGTPSFLIVTDSLKNSDSVSTNMKINNLYNLKPANYRLRVFAIERCINYFNPPGINGETKFLDVFRYSITDSSGITINNSSGNYSFNFKYYIQPNWNDSMLYTICFVQNDDTKEIINSAKSRIITHNKKIHKLNKSIYNYFNEAVIYKNLIPNFYKAGTKLFSINDSNISSTFSYELFEDYFPPIGWRNINSDNYITFEKVNNTNGPSINGDFSIRMPFYYYSPVGQRDSLISCIFKNVTVLDTLKFDYAYAEYLSNYTDSLKVYISTDNGNSFLLIFSKGGTNLATAQSTTLPFTPSNTNEWKTFSYPLSNILLPNNSVNIMIKPYLYQNFPNPFNPVTKIKYSIISSSTNPINANVSLKIYDITGRLISKIVDEIQQSGNYEVVWDGKYFSSGVYFYQLKVDNYIITKKMLLIK